MHGHGQAGDGALYWNDIVTEGDGLITWESEPEVATAAPERSSSLPVWPMSIPAVLGLLWGLGALIEGLRRTRHHRLFVDALGVRARVTDGAAPLVLADLAERAGIRRSVRLTTSAALRSPVALDGWREAEICVPGAALALPADELRALLAHETAHLARRDPAWLVAFAVIESVFWMQPLNRLARRGQQEAAEALCDNWAALQSAPTAMAGCLLQVAQWLRAPGGLRAYVVPSPVVVGMAAKPSALRGRVERLIAERPARLGRGLPALAAVVALAALVAGTGFSRTAAPDQRDAFDTAFSTFDFEEGYLDGAGLEEMEWGGRGEVEREEDELAVGDESVDYEWAEAVLVEIEEPVVESAIRPRVRLAPPSRFREVAPHVVVDSRPERAPQVHAQPSAHSSGFASEVASFAVSMTGVGLAAAGAALGELAGSGTFEEMLEEAEWADGDFSREQADAVRQALRDAGQTLADQHAGLQGADVAHAARLAAEQQQRHAEHAAELDRMAADLEQQAAALRLRLRDAH